MPLRGVVRAWAPP